MRKILYVIMLSHEEQVRLDEFVIKTLQQKLEKLEAEEREFSAQLKDKRREFEDLECGQRRRKRRPMV